jgi:hypothetical protein
LIFALARVRVIVLVLVQLALGHIPRLVDLPAGPWYLALGALQIPHQFLVVRLIIAHTLKKGGFERLNLLEAFLHALL